MTTPSEVPALSGSFERYGHPAPDALGSDALFLGDFARLQTTGNWRPEELRTVRNRLGSVSLYGVCLTDEQTIERALTEVVEGSDRQALTRLPGSYTAIVSQQDRLTVFADLANQFPFYYRTDERGLHFGSLAQPLQRRSGACQIDTITLAAGIAATVPTDIIAGRSALAGVWQLEAGHMLEAELRGGIRTAPYETLEVPTVFALDEAADALRAALQGAMRGRAALGYRMSADFSGGLDSTSAAYLMAHELNEPLLVATRYSGDVPSEDLEYARAYLALAESQGLFSAHEFERPAATTVYANLETALAGDAPDHSILTRVPDKAYFQFLRDQGSELHITGSGADFLLDMDPSIYLGRLAKPGTYGRFVRSVFEVARVGCVSPLKVLKDVRAQQDMNPVLQLHIMSRILQGGRSPEALRYGRQIFGAAMPEWLTKRARRELSDLTLARAEALVLDPEYDRGNYDAYAGLKSLGPHIHGDMQYAARFGFRRHAVYLDNEVLRACFSLPTHIRVNPWVFKQLLVRATEGLVPPVVTGRATKGDYSRQGMEGLRAAQTTIYQLLRDSRLADLGVVDPGRIRKTLDSVMMGVDPPWIALDRFIATELWLRSLDGHDAPTGAALPSPSVPTPRPAKTPLANEARYGMPAGTFMTTRPTGAVAVNLPGGTYHRLNTDALRVVEALRDTSNFGEALTALEACYPTIDRAQLREGASDLVRQLSVQGIVAEGLETFSIMAGSGETNVQSSVAMTRQAHEAAKTRLRDYPAATGGLVLALGMRRMPFARQVRILSGLQEGWCRTLAGEDEAAFLLAAVQRVAAPYPGRIACVEMSMAAVLAAALRGRKLTLALGVKADPERFHAWPEVDGKPIRTARDPEISGVFEAIFKV